MSDQISRPLTLIENAIKHLRRIGRVVEPTDMPGLYRIDGGPEVTTGQVISIALKTLRRG